MSYSRPATVKVGEKWNMLLVLSEVTKRSPFGKRIVHCRCDCGTELDIVAANLRSGNTTNCGCVRSKKMTEKNWKHGEATRGAQSAEYLTWERLIGRCENPKLPGFEHYGGRGIKVCPQWRISFDTFLQDMGRKPDPTYSIDRIDVNGDYEPGNCRWATNTQQARNKRDNHLITYGGQTKTMVEWAEEKNMSLQTLSSRLGKLGWSIKKALTEPIKLRRKRLA